MGGKRENDFRNLSTVRGMPVTVIERFKGTELAESGYVYNAIGNARPTDGEVGCLLAHRRIWVDMAESETSQWWVVCEDDAVPHADFATHVEDVAQHASNAGVDFVYLNYMDPVLRNNRVCASAKTLTCGGLFMFTPLPVYGTAAYMITRRAANILLQNLSGGFLFADDVTWVSYEQVEDKSAFLQKWQNMKFMRMYMTCSFGTAPNSKLLLARLRYVN